MTYTKPVKSLTITTAQLEESVSSGSASDFAFLEIEQGETVKEQNKLIPFKSIRKAVVSVSSESADKADPYGCEESVPGNALTNENGNVLTDENSNPIVTGD